MQFALKDYQTDTVWRILRHLSEARDDVLRKNRRVAFALSATTGAGKTVMATAVIEALFAGSEEYEAEADPSAVVLWVTDDPNLNEQTRHRFIQCGDRLQLDQLRIIGYGPGQDPADQEVLDPTTVYFLNVQKLRADSSYVKRDVEERIHSLWDTIGSTIEHPDRMLYLVLDEAHRGMRRETARSTIVQRLVNGHDGIPPVPIVWGISATVDRFQAAMQAAHAEGRTMLTAVEVDPRAVQESGLLKDVIVLEFPDESGVFDTTFLRSAIRGMRETTALWDEYACREKLATPVTPLMVLQVGNKPRDADLTHLLQVLYTEWPDLPSDAVANVFGEHMTLSLGPYTVPWIAPQDVQDVGHIRVLLAKDAVSTGWDCPRAEVLFSLRPASDRTHITQMLGRMVRTPLARRVEGDERLNAVTCVLPHFNQPTATEVALVLTGKKVLSDDPDAESAAGTGRKVLTSPVTLGWNPHVPEEVGELLTRLPSEVSPSGKVKPVSRLLSLATAFARDNLMPAPDTEALNTLFRELDGQMAKHRSMVDEGVNAILTADVRRITSRVGEGSLIESSRQERADDRTVDDAFITARRILGSKVANGYAKRLATADGNTEDTDFLDARARIAALMTITEVSAAIDRTAEDLARRWLAEHRIAIRNLSDAHRSTYNEIQRQDREPQPVTVTRPTSRIENTKDAEGAPLPVRERHLLSDERGTVPVGTFNAWELAVIDNELAQPGCIGWYRNPARGTEEALRIPYYEGDVWKSMQPDFIVFSRKQDESLGASIVDPHSTHLADALVKLRGLAGFAERHGSEFVRIEAISRVGNELRVLDMKDAQVRAELSRASAEAMFRNEALAHAYLTL